MYFGEEIGFIKIHERDLPEIELAIQRTAITDEFSVHFDEIIRKQTYIVQKSTDYAYFLFTRNLFHVFKQKTTFIIQKRQQNKTNKIPIDINVCYTHSCQQRFRIPV